MNDDISVTLTENEMVLFQMGQAVLELQGRDTEKEREKLRMACSEAKQLFQMENEYSLLSQSEEKQLRSARDWNILLRFDKKVSSLLKKHMRNSRLYGWTPLSRILIRQRCAQSVDTLAQDENDPLEMILEENVSGMNRNATEPDHMEALLLEYEIDRE